MKTSYILTKLLAAVMLLTIGHCVTSCNKDDDASNTETPTVQSEVLVLFSIDGLGDGSYNDQILRGIKLMENENSKGMTIRFITPTSLEDVESACKSWWENIDKPIDDKGTVPRRLLVLASSDYVDIARQVFANAEMNINRCVLAFEAEDSGDETEQIRTFGIIVIDTCICCIRILSCHLPERVFDYARGVISYTEFKIQYFPIMFTNKIIVSCRCLMPSFIFNKLIVRSEVHGKRLAAIGASRNKL